jgi:transposase-like protein
VRAPQVNDKRTDEATGERKRFSSAILPAWSRKSPKVAEVLPLLYLHGLSTSDFSPALEQFLGTGAGLSAATITRLTTQWQDEANAFNKRSVADTDDVYCWVDGIHLKVRLEQDKVCLRLRTRVTKGPGSRAAGVAMAFKLIESAQARRAVKAPHLVALVRAGATFEKGKIVEPPENQPAPTPAETAA